MLRRNIVGVVLRERVLALTRATLPGLIPEVDDAVWVEDRGAGFAEHWRVLHKCHVFNVLKGRVHAADGNDYPCGADLVAGPEVPRKSNAIL